MDTKGHIGDRLFGGLSGIIGKHKPIIVLNKNFPVERKRFTAMHELGHLLLDFDDAFPQKDVERFCNLFEEEKEQVETKIPAELFEGQGV